MKNILILCTGNSCRSQMAEGYLRQFAGGKANIYSAGIEAHGVNPRTIEVMAEDEIDISVHTSNKAEEYLAIPFDYIITVCDHALEHCPAFPSRAKKIHYNFPDPWKAKGSEEEIMQEYRNVRDAIKDWCGSFTLLNPL